jgi:hypothetical protein
MRESLAVVRRDIEVAEAHHFLVFTTGSSYSVVGFLLTVTNPEAGD